MEPALCDEVLSGEEMLAAEFLKSDIDTVRDGQTILRATCAISLLNIPTSASALGLSEYKDL